VLPVVVSYDLVSNFTVFGQFTTTFDNHWHATFLEGVGFAYRPLPKLQMDIELDYGKNDSIQSTRFLLGFSSGF
jgi:hypothetical protein